MLSVRLTCLKFLCPPPEIQHIQRHQAVPRCPVPLRVLRGRDSVPQVPHRPPVLQRLHVLLARQLRHRAGAGDVGGRLRLVLLGLQETRRHARLPPLLCLWPRAPVRPWRSTTSSLGFSVSNRSGFPRYHTGSLAFGSLILAIVQVIRVILEYLDHRLKGTETGLGNEEVGTAGGSVGPEPMGDVPLLGDAPSRCSWRWS